MLDLELVKGEHPHPVILIEEILDQVQRGIARKHQDEGKQQRFEHALPAQADVELREIRVSIAFLVNRAAHRQLDQRDRGKQAQEDRREPERGPQREEVAAVKRWCHDVVVDPQDDQEADNQRDDADDPVALLGKDAAVGRIFAHAGGEERRLAKDRCQRHQHGQHGAHRQEVEDFPQHKDGVGRFERLGFRVAQVAAVVL